MNTILVPTDFSDGAFNALEYALRLARVLNFQVQIVHAYYMPATGSMVMVDITDIMDKNTREELAVLRKKVEQLPYANDIAISYRAEHGPVVEVINRICREEGVEFVVMGTQGASGITDKWLGTNAMDAAKFVEDPLLIVPADMPYKSIEHVLFLTDLKLVGNEKHLKFLAELVHNCGSQIEFLHITKHDEAIEEEKIEAYRQQLNRTFGENRPRIKFVDGQEVYSGIKTAIAAKDPDVITIVRHKYGFFEGLFKSSTSQQLISETKRPMLILQDK